jgi:sugar O-acyltransferase (sialic acid O-acetyltransferase NeuD family)
MIYILGNGGHAKILHNILVRNHLTKGMGEEFLSKVKDSIKEISHREEERIVRNMEYMDFLCLGIGDMKSRERTYKKYIESNWTGVVCNSSIVHHEDVFLEATCQILTNSCVLAGSSIGIGTIINTGASVDHDCKVGNFVHIAPHVTLCGNVEVGDRTLIGAGVVVYPGVKIGKDCTIMTNKAIYKDIPDNTVIKFQL